MNPLEARNDHMFNPFVPHPELDDVGGLALPKVLKPAEARRDAAGSVNRVLANQRLLQQILERHEAVIQRRWEKKGGKQRLEILLKAWGDDIPPTHRPDFAAWRSDRTAFVWPYVNRKDLVKPRALLLMLKARGRNHPSVFAAADADATCFGRVTMAVVPIFLNEHVMIMNGVTQDGDYGKLVAWEDHPDAFEWMTSRKQCLPGEGLLILEAQDRLLQFLVECCRLILHDIPADRLAAEAAEAAAGFASLAVMAEEAPYRVPQNLDLARIEGLLAARKADAEDHVWALREDPGYFTDSLYEMRDHRLEMLKDVNGQAHPTTKPLREGILWSRVIGNVLVEAHFQLELFSELHAQAKQPRDLQRRHPNRIKPGEDLPGPYLDALLRFGHYLNQMAKGYMSQLKTAFPASPPMRAFFAPDAPVPATSSHIRAMTRPGAKKDGVTSQLLWLLQTLWEDGHNLFLARLPTVVDELDRLLKSEPRAAELVSPYVARLIGELSVVSECLRQLDLFQPWADTFDAELTGRADALKKDFAERTRTEALVLKFEYPVSKCRIQATVDRMRAAEAALDAFWAGADELVHATAGDLRGTALDHLLSQQSRLLQRTPEWVPPAAKAHKKQPEPANAELLGQGFSDLRLTPGTMPPSARREVLAELQPIKTQPKTRGPPAIPSSASSSSPMPPLLSPVQADVQPTFSVSQRALKVFRILFFDPEANTTPGEVAWTDFLQALREVGFAARKLYGSVWHFQPSRLDVDRSIQFHEPHPRGKIPFLVARRHGRRLARAYGWGGGMFTSGK
ncbi:hypothetical protein GE09DRAFT_1294017 [Coniochaeta sp. 2T2.1]|nr:hypothetical protein GE09DRAFT_1294017 [Coniochaeta sp. 2T2.1]